jgi:hypothetical protein
MPNIGIEIGQVYPENKPIKVRPVTLTNDVIAEFGRPDSDALISPNTPKNHLYLPQASCRYRKWFGEIIFIFQRF